MPVMSLIHKVSDHAAYRIKYLLIGRRAFGDHSLSLLRYKKLRVPSTSPNLAYAFKLNECQNEDRLQLYCVPSLARRSLLELSSPGLRRLSRTSRPALPRHPLWDCSSGSIRMRSSLARMALR